MLIDYEQMLYLEIEARENDEIAEWLENFIFATDTNEEEEF